MLSLTMDTFPSTPARPFSSRPVAPASSSARSFRTARYPAEETRAEVSALRRPRAGVGGVDALAYASATVGKSDAMQRLRSQVTRIAPYFRTALITGLAGTGKEGVARMLHALSPCGEGEFVGCEASAMAEAMLREDGRAVIEAVAGGTLFLDDVGEVPPALQSALLRVWTYAGKGKMRVVAGTHRDLRTMGVTGQFRTDLAQRLMGVEIAVPALGERREDLPAVIAEVLKKVGGDRDLALTDAALNRMLEHAWPGDLAEVEKAIWAATKQAEGATLLGLEHLPGLYVDEPAEEVAVKMERLQDVVQQHVLGVLTRCAGNKLRAAEVLGISRSTLYRMLESCVAGEGFSSF